MNRPITLSDIAARVGVSKMTVSSALHGSGARKVRVGQDTVRRVREAAEELGYRPNELARSLKLSRTNTVGFYTGADRYASGGAFLNDIVTGMRDGCDAERKDLLIHHQYRDCTAEDIYRSIVDGRIESLIIWTQPDDPVVPLLAQSRLPVIAIADCVPGIPAVLCDDKSGGEIMAGYLFEQGHRIVAYRRTRLSRSSAEIRRAGFEAAAAKLGLQVIPIQEGIDYDVSPEEKDVLFAPHSPHPTAVACWNDLSARELLYYCMRHQIDVPKSLAVTGYDGFEASLRPWNLTTIRAPWIEAARRAVELVTGTLSKDDLPEITTIAVQLVVGDTA